MKYPTQIVAKLVFSFLITTMGPLSYTAFSTESSPQVKAVDAQLVKELANIKNSLSKNNVQAAKESLTRMSQLSTNLPHQQNLISIARKNIEAHQGVGTKTRTPLGSNSQTPVLEPNNGEMDAFDNAFLKGDVAEVERIFNKYPRTPQDSSKKTDFLDYASNAIKLLKEEKNASTQKAANGLKTRTALGFKNAFDSFFKELKKGLSSENINSAKGFLVTMEKYAKNSEADQSSLKFVKEKIDEYEKKPPHSSKDTDVSDEDIAAFKDAFESNNLGKAEGVFNKYHRTPQDSKKKKEFLDLAQMELQVMR